MGGASATAAARARACEDGANRVLVASLQVELKRLQDKLKLEGVDASYNPDDDPPLPESAPPPGTASELQQLTERLEAKDTELEGIRQGLFGL